MLIELVIENLGVLAAQSLVVGDGMTALTGETGAGKTMVVSAIQLLAGSRADSTIVRPGAAEARVDGRFVTAAGEEVVLSRVVAVEGRSRAYVDGRPAPVSQLAELAGALVDLHGQHAHQSLLAPGTQRAALDRWGGIDLAPLLAARAELARLDAELAGVGGDARARAREADLLRFQVAELDAAAITGADEDDQLHLAELVLGDATAAREAGATAYAALADDDGVADALGGALTALTGRPAFAELEARLRGLAAEVTDVAAEVRDRTEAMEDDPSRLAEVGQRRALLRDLRRKYGDSLEDVLAYAGEARARLEEIEGHDARAARFEAERTAVLGALGGAEVQVAAARRAAAPTLAAAVASHLHELAMPRAEVQVAVEGTGPADDVRFLLAAGPGEPAHPLAKVASGGELARAMLALRLALLEGQARDEDRPAHDGRTLVFDEVDAGIGGEAAVAVGRALAALGEVTQVLVVTHLPQVAAFADHQVVVTKVSEASGTTATAAPVEGADRVVELSRMLSGQPGSAIAREHAEELLASAAFRKGGDGSAS